MIAVVERDVGILLGHAAAGAQKQPVAQLEDVRLVNARDALAALAAGRFEREPRNPLRRRLGHHPQAFDDAGHDLVLQAAVQALGVFADDDQIDIFVTRRHAGHRLAPADSWRRAAASAAARR